MATTKKTHTTKKTPVSKKTTAKTSKKTVKKAPRLTWRFYVVTIGIFVISVATVIVIGYLTASVVEKHTAQDRLAKINDIYASLNLNDEAYPVERSDVFGDKRVYDWDKGRSRSSEVDYVHADTVSNTVAELDAKIKAAGFTFIDEPYPGAVSVQYHYKSAEGEYVRLTVYSKPYQDALRNSLIMEGVKAEDTVKGMDKNAGPAYVIVKVNLDDNNE